MKKFLTLIGTILMIISLTACGRNAQTNENVANEETTSETISTEENAQESVSINLSDDNIQISEEDGYVTLGGEWPDNEYTKIIPKPTFGTVSLSQVSEAEGFIVQITGATIENTKQYIEVLQEEGFTENQELFDGSNIEGLETYEYSAQNSDGVSICVDYAMEIFMITVTK